jgi:hypothetical protein
MGKRGAREGLSVHAEARRPPLENRVRMSDAHLAELTRLDARLDALKVRL